MELPAIILDSAVELYFLEETLVVKFDDLVGGPMLFFTITSRTIVHLALTQCMHHKTQLWVILLHIDDELKHQNKSALQNHKEQRLETKHRNQRN